MCTRQMAGEEKSHIAVLCHVFRVIMQASFMVQIKLLFKNQYHAYATFYDF